MQPITRQNTQDVAVAVQPSAQKMLKLTQSTDTTAADNASTISKSSWFPLRLRGGLGPCCACIDGILCCCALEECCCCGLEELC